MARGGGLQRPPLRRIHDAIYERIHDAIYEKSARARSSLEYHRTRSTNDLVKSLRPRPENKEGLKVKSDGRVFQGNTRIKVLEERGYPVDDLPREVNESLHQLTSGANPHNQWLPRDQALLLRAIIEDSFTRDLDRWIGHALATAAGAGFGTEKPVASQ